MASRLPVLQIVPRLGSQLDGVADYAQILGAALQREAQADVRFLSGDPEDSPTAEFCPGAANRLQRRSGDELASVLRSASPTDPNEPHAVLLHYVNYGYEKRGCPFWLIDGLKQWKRQQSSAHLVTMFHEIYASGPPWRSSFWLSPIQRHLARALYGISDEVVTNRAESGKWLRGGRRTIGRKIAVLPVFSSLGEPDEVVEWTKRSAQMVVAGRTGAVDRAYGRRREQLAHACSALDIEEIVDVGARFDPVPAKVGDVPVTALGHLQPAQVCAVLRKARAGFIDYPSGYLGKSTVFAAYAAHGLVPVVSCHRGPDEPGLAEGTNYWVPTHGAVAPRDFESIASSASAWYARHRLEVQAREFAHKLSGAVD